MSQDTSQNTDTQLLAALQKAIVSLSEAVHALHEMRQILAAPEAQEPATPETPAASEGPRYRIAEGEKPKKCRGCGATIYWAVTPRGRNMPVNPDGTPHWDSCPDRNLFKTDAQGHNPQERPAAQEAAR